jgi:hypothetical protein
MNIGDRVTVFSGWSSFRGCMGKIVQLKPYVMVLLDGEDKPMAFGTSEIVEESNPRHVGGSE